MKLIRKQVLLDEDTSKWLELQAFKNKQAGNKELDSISKVVRQAISEFQERAEAANKKGKK